MKIMPFAAIGGVALILGAAPAWAHHAFAAEFDAKKPVHLVGVVSKVELINPHAWIHVDVKNADGSVSNWAVECGNPNTLLRRGYTKASLMAGTEIVVQGFQAKRGGFIVNGSTVEFKDGRKLFLGSSGDEGRAPK